MQDEGTSFGSYKINPLIGALPTFTEDACKEEESVGATCTLPEIETQSLVGELVTRFVVGDRVTVNASCGDNCFSGGEVGTVVGITLSGNEMGLTLEEVDALPEAERRSRQEAAGARFLGWGAHYVIATVADLPAVLGQIEGRLARGERP